MAYPAPNQVKITDKMWSPILERTRTVTIPDVLDKFEGRHIDHVARMQTTSGRPIVEELQVKKLRSARTIRSGTSNWWQKVMWQMAGTSAFPGSTD